LDSNQRADSRRSTRDVELIEALRVKTTQSLLKEEWEKGAGRNWQSKPVCRRHFGLLAVLMFVDTD
jgi:hypothetical protein